MSVIAADLRVRGELTATGTIKIEGTVVGNVRAQAEVLVAEGGLVEGNMYTREAVVGGSVTGSVFACERVEVRASGLVRGDIQTPRLVVQEGARIDGDIRTVREAAAGGLKLS